MKFTILLMIIGIIIPIKGISQDYEKTKADSLREEGNLKLAIEEFSKKYKEDSTNQTNTYNYACALALDRQIDTAFYYLNIAIDRDTSVQVLNDPDFYYLMTDDRWRIIEDKIVKKVESKYGKYENLALSKELWRMKIKDQAFYYHIGLSKKHNGKDSPITQAIRELKHKLNTENLIRLEEIILKEGWPKKSVVKEQAASTAFLIIQHCKDLEVQKRYLPILKEGSEKGEIDKSDYAYLQDRVNIREGKKQIYGSQVFRNEDGSYNLDKLEEPEYVNQRRASVNLMPIEEYLQFFGIEWNVEQKEK